MAMFPCSVGKHPYPQPQQSAYWTTATRGHTQTLRGRLCPRHYRDLAIAAIDHMLLVDEDSVFSKDCESCGDEATWMASLRLYPAKDEPVQYASSLCGACVEAMGQRLLVANFEPLADR